MTEILVAVDSYNDAITFAREYENLLPQKDGDLLGDIYANCVLLHLNDKENKIFQQLISIDDRISHISDENYVFRPLHNKTYTAEDVKKAFEAGLKIGSIYR